MSSPLNPNAPPSARPPPADAADPGRKRKMTADASSALRMLETHLEGKQTPPPGATRPPALTVDISAIEMARQASGIEEAVPCTPANTRSAVRTDLHRAVSAGDIEAASTFSMNAVFSMICSTALTLRCVLACRSASA